MDSGDDEVASWPPVVADTVASGGDELAVPTDVFDQDGTGFDVAPQQASMKVIVKRVGSSTEEPCLELTLSQDASVMDLKKMIAEELDARKIGGDPVPSDRQRLIFSGRMLSNDQANLREDVKMSLNYPNYIHLAPIPDGMEASQRRRNENNVDEAVGGSRPPLARSSGLRRLLSREGRRARESPYGSRLSRPSNDIRRIADSALLDSATAHLMHGHSVGTTAPPDLAVGVVPSPLVCQPVLVSTPAGVTEALAVPAAVAIPVQVSHAVVVNHPSVETPGINLLGGVDDVRREIWDRTNDLLPLCRALPDHLVRCLTSAGSNSSQLQELVYRNDLEEASILLEQVAHRGLGLADSLRRFLYARRAVAQSSRSLQNASPSYQDPFPLT